ncbi:MAG: LysR substrate-binding domain-containing protein, partial [Geminicoccaceae bacterium]
GPDLKMSIVASQAYLDRKGIPRAPNELIKHEGICFAFGGADRLAPWNFEGKEGVYSVMPKPRMIANDLRSLLNYAEVGLGLAYVYAETAAPLIASGQLVEVLKDQMPSMSRYSLNYLTKRHMTKRLRAFIDIARQ